jgi:hypothetical protein
MKSNNGAQTEGNDLQSDDFTVQRCANRPHQLGALPKHWHQYENQIIKVRHKEAN